MIPDECCLAPLPRSQEVLIASTISGFVNTLVLQADALGYERDSYVRGAVAMLETITDNCTFETYRPT